MRSFLLALVVAIVATSLHARPNPGTVPWTTLESADAADGLRLLYFGAEWCAPCRALETGVFDQPGIAAALTAFTPIYIDGDDVRTPARMEHFAVVVFPTLLVVDDDDKEVARFVG